MRKNGFTLVELMAVVLIISLVAILTVPNIVNQIKKSKESKNKMVEDIVLAQAKRYVNDNKSEFEEDNYCLDIDTLVENDYLKEDVINSVSGFKDNRVIKITGDNKLKYEVVDKKSCCRNDYCDPDGNGYTEVYYIESTGTQYIDTNYVFKNKPKVTGEIMITSNSDLDIMGTSTNAQGCFIIDFKGDYLYYRYSSPSYTGFSTGIGANSWGYYEFSDKIIANGVEKGAIATYDFSSNTQSFLIGRGRNYGKARFREIKMYDGDELVRDLVPVYRDSDEKLGMFDTVNKKFYYSKTDSDFYSPTLDPELVDKEVNYIESTGSQYIDTNYVFKNKPKITGEIMITSGDDRDIMGTSTNAQGCFIIDFASNTLYYRYSSSGYTRFDTGIEVNKWYDFEFDDKVIVDGIEKGSISSYDFSSNTQSFLIGRGRSYGKARFREIKMYDGDELVRDLVPYYKKELNEAGMLDKAHNVFYRNKGTIGFLWG